MTDKWHVGQKAVINRTRVVTVERVTPSGRVIAEGRTFEADGHERGGRDFFHRAKLEPLTPEIEAEMALIVRGRKADNDSTEAVADAVNWLRQTFKWGRVPCLADVLKAEKLTIAIREAMEPKEPSDAG